MRKYIVFFIALVLSCAGHVSVAAQPSDRYAASSGSLFGQVGEDTGR